jgi:hypothetical protein
LTLPFHRLSVFAATSQAQGDEKSVAEFERTRRHVLGLFADNAANAMYALQVAERFRDYQALIMWCNRSNQPANLERYKAVRSAEASKVSVVVEFANNNHLHLFVTFAAQLPGFQKALYEFYIKDGE